LLEAAILLESAEAALAPQPVVQVLHAALTAQLDRFRDQRMGRRLVALRDHRKDLPEVRYAIAVHQLHEADHLLTVERANEHTALGLAFLVALDGGEVLAVVRERLAMAHRVLVVELDDGLHQLVVERHDAYLDAGPARLADHVAGLVIKLFLPPMLVGGERDPRDALTFVVQNRVAVRSRRSSAAKKRCRRARPPPSSLRRTPMDHRRYSWYSARSLAILRRPPLTVTSFASTNIPHPVDWPIPLTEFVNAGHGRRRSA